MMDASAFHVKIDETMQAKFDAFAVLLVTANETVNLTRITEKKEIETLHFLDSLAGCQILFPGGEGRRIALTDLGAGAGFPGIPIKIAYPEVDLTAIDAVKKKLAFLEEAAKVLSFDTGTFRTLHGRAEDLGHTELRETQDVVTARAVAHLATLCEYALPLLKTGGRFLAYKAKEAETELAESKNAMNLLGGEVRDVFPFTLPGTDVKRTIIAVEKTKPTPERYPRRAPLPGKKPL